MVDIQFPLGADAGIASISGTQTVVFTQYVKTILPLDGFVFWVKADILSQSSLIGSMGYNANKGAYNASLSAAKPAKQIIAKGSLHIAATKRQEETETYGIHKVTFTSEEPLHQGFEDIDENHIYIGSFDDVRFAFSDRANFYVQAGIWHYYGDAIYPYMETQIVDNPGELNTKELIVSNSLPLWLGLNNHIPFYGFGNTVLLYPSYLTQPNIHPPFGTIHIESSGTQALAGTPQLGFRLQHSQLVKDHVRIVLYGVGNDRAMDFVDAVNQYSADYGYFGLMSCPIMRDEKMKQDELSILAQRKSIEYDVSYNQTSVRDIARQIIGQAIPTFGTFSKIFTNQPLTIMQLRADMTLAFPFIV